MVNERNIPASLVVTLDNDLVESCQPGECITLWYVFPLYFVYFEILTEITQPFLFYSGTIERRWKPIVYGKKPEISIAMRAISLTRDKKRRMMTDKFQPEDLILMQVEWEDNVANVGELQARDIIIESICPEVRGMYVVKLAIALMVCSGGIENTTTTSCGSSMRGQSHLLLVGDPGLAKSRLLMSAAAFAPRAVLTTGMGSSAAGLTAAAVQENGEWQLEAGALVLGDGGICCIDEFNLMRETDRASIHEAMEQQTVSLAKAGMVCKLSTRCAVLAATNPRNLYTMSDPEGTSSLNIGIASPLMSRFDLVYILRDDRNEDWDDLIATHLLELAKGVEVMRLSNQKLWSTEKLQAHFATIRTVHPEMTPEANKILSEYFQRCRNDPRRDNARTTVRLLDSLRRLAQAHARLLFRSTVNVYDAVIVIRLMESTLGFGRILKSFDVIREEMPLGPTRQDIEEVYSALDLGTFIPDAQDKYETRLCNLQIVENGSSQHRSDRNPTESVSISQNLTQSSQNIVIINDEEEFVDDELDQILTLNNLDTVSVVQKTHSRSMSLLSQSLITPTSSQVNNTVSSPIIPSQTPSQNGTSCLAQPKVTLVNQVSSMSDIFQSSIESSQHFSINGIIDDNTETDDLDQILSLALDNAEETISQISQKSIARSQSSSITNQTKPHTVVPKLSSFRFRGPRKSIISFNGGVSKKENISAKAQINDTRKTTSMIVDLANEVTSPNQTKNVTKRNRLLDDSDDSNDDKEIPCKRNHNTLSPVKSPTYISNPGTSKVSPKTISKLNAFLNPNQLQRVPTEANAREEMEVDVIIPDNKLGISPEDDSAYGTQQHDKGTRRSQAHTTTSTIATLRQSQPLILNYADDDDEDLSCLDSLDL